MPDTFFIPLLIVTVSMAVNAATSAPFLPLYFLEMIPKVILLITVNMMLGGMIHHIIAILSVVEALYTFKVAISIHRVNINLLQQKLNLAAAKEDVEIASRAKSSFLAMISHEVRTPLNGILGITNLMRDTKLTDMQSEYLETIRYSGETLLAMLNDILDFSKIEAGKLDIEESGFDLRRMIAGVTNLMSSRAMEKKLNLKQSVAPDVPEYVRSDPTRIRQILLNLISNAIKFSQAGPVSLRVKVVSRDGVNARLRFEIQDAGIGIPPAALTGLFKEFTQVDSSINRRFGGTCLGLSICKKLVELMSGKIGVESEEGQGSLFWFELPVAIIGAAEAGIVIEDGQKNAAEMVALLHILLVEDNAINRQVASGLLQRHGHKIDFAENGAEAFGAVQSKDYDVVLMDMQMPIMDGIEATAQIRKLGGHYAGIPIIALTANLLRGEEERCRAAGMSDYISKPINPHQLYSVIARNVQKGQSEKMGKHYDVDKTGYDAGALSLIERQLGVEYISNFVAAGVLELQRLMQVAKESWKKDRRYEDLHFATHDVKSLSAMLGMMELSGIAADIELACKENNIEQVVGLMDRLQPSFDQNLRALRQIYPDTAAA